MSDIPNLITHLKRILKSRQLTYIDVAQSLDLSEASVKRLFANNGFSLQRLEQVCHLVGISLSELVLEAEQDRNKVEQLSWDQEKSIVADPEMLLVTYLVLNGFHFNEIIQDYRFSVTDLIQLLAKLDRMKIIELLPENKIRLLTARNFSWIKRGPIEQFVLKNARDAFLSAKFDQPEESLKFIPGLLSKTSMVKVKSKLEKLEQEIHQLAEEDTRLPLSERKGFSALLAIRFWDFAAFSELKR